MATSANSCTINSSSDCTPHCDAPKKRDLIWLCQLFLLCLLYYFSLDFILFCWCFCYLSFNLFSFYQLHFSLFPQTGLKCRAFTTQRELVSAPRTAHGVDSVLSLHPSCLRPMSRCHAIVFKHWTDYPLL